MNTPYGSGTALGEKGGFAGEKSHPLPDLLKIENAISAIHCEQSRYEIRILSNGNDTRIFTADEKGNRIGARFAYEAQLRDPTANAFLTINPLSASVEGYAKDAHVLRRCWLPFDCDPMKDDKSGSATEAECENASQLANELYFHLSMSKLNWPRPLLLNSGNGCWLLYRIDLPNDEGSKRLVRSVIAALADHFSNFKGAKIDPSSSNASRIIRLGGTVNRKGNATPERPHRLAEFLGCDPTLKLESVTNEQLWAVCSTKKQHGILNPVSIKTSEQKGRNGISCGEHRAGLLKLNGHLRGGHGLSVDATVRLLRRFADDPDFLVELDPNNPFTDEDLRGMAESIPAKISSFTISRSMENSPFWNDICPWPVLDRAARYGLSGEILDAIEHETEADPVAMLFTLLVAYGNSIGANSRAVVGDDEHPGRLFVALVGSTSAGGKGTSLAAVRPFLRAADEKWLQNSYVSGFASGEGIISRMSGYHIVEGKSVEKRAFVVESEFARLLSVNGRDSSTSSPVIRGAWDDGRMQLIRSKDMLLAEGAHVSILAHVTPDELRAKLSSTDVAGGFANRFLFASCRRARKLPSGGNVDPAVIDRLGKRLLVAMEHGRKERVLKRTPRAEKLWEEYYMAEPDREGIMGEITARAHSQKLRLSVLYALLDLREKIDAEHVIAAEAAWRYASKSAEHIFGELTGSVTQDRILAAAREAYPGELDGTAVRDLLGRKRSECEIAAARLALEQRGLIRIEQDNTTGGRPRTLIFAIPSDQRDERRQKERDTLFSRLSSL